MSDYAAKSHLLSLSVRADRKLIRDRDRKLLAIYASPTGSQSRNRQWACLHHHAPALAGTPIVRRFKLASFVCNQNIDGHSKAHAWDSGRVMSEWVLSAWLGPFRSAKLGAQLQKMGQNSLLSLTEKWCSSYWKRMLLILKKDACLTDKWSQQNRKCTLMLTLNQGTLHQLKKLGGKRGSQLLHANPLTTSRAELALG